jgi:small subunit ribosomal protein S18
MARPQQQRTRTKREDRDRKLKKKISILDQERVEWIDYKDVNLLRRFMSERAKIRARRVTGNDTQQQRAISRAIRVSREMGLLPYSVRQVTHRNKGRGRGDRGDRDTGTLPMPSQPPPTPSGEIPADAVTDEFETTAPEPDAMLVEVETNGDAPMAETVAETVAEPADETREGEES